MISFMGEQSVTLKICRLQFHGYKIENCIRLKAGLFSFIETSFFLDELWWLKVLFFSLFDKLNSINQGCKLELELKFELEK